MKPLLTLLLFIPIILACPRREDSPCHAQVFLEEIHPVYETDPHFYRVHDRTSIRCAGKCPDGTPCDSIVELTHAVGGAPIRRVRCGCNNEQSNQDCGIIIEHIYYSADTIDTHLYCTHGDNCPIASDTCIQQRQRLSNDTIRSLIFGSDSLIILKWLITCECMDE